MARRGICDMRHNVRHSDHEDVSMLQPAQNKHSQKIAELARNIACDNPARAADNRRDLERSADLSMGFQACGFFFPSLNLTEIRKT
jgi:hypothetical protein